MVVSGVFFCVASLYAVFGHGFSAALRVYKYGWFAATFLVFYGVLGGATAFFHLSYLARGWPTQTRAGMYGIATGLAIAGIFMAIMRFVL